MIRSIIFFLLLLSVFLTSPASAFKFFGPNGEMSASDEDIARRQAEDQARAEQDRQRAEAERAWDEERARNDEHNARMDALYRTSTPLDPMFSTCPEPRTKYNDGPAPGGHRRHEWRERTGFNTPAERTRYRREIQRLNRELEAERAKPNPRGSTVREMREQREQRMRKN